MGPIPGDDARYRHLAILGDHWPVVIRRDERLVRQARLAVAGVSRAGQARAVAAAGDDPA